MTDSKKCCQERLYPLFHRGPSDITGVSVQNGSGTEGQCVTSGETVLLNNTDESEGFEGSVFDGNGFKASSVMCLPLKVHKKTYGCFQIINKLNSDGFDDDERLICERTAALAAMSIDEMGVELEIPEKKNVLISLKGVTREFPSGDGVVKILKGIDLDIYENEFVVVLGESGCGKSTMLNIIGGMDQLTDGTLLIEGMADQDKCRWIILDMQGNTSYLLIQNNIQSIRNMGITFSLVFILVGAMVIYATLGRIVDEQRKLIGATKALGFFNREILGKYLIYGISGTILGMLAGTGVAYFVFQKLVSSAYAKMYTFELDKPGFNISMR